MNVTEHPAGNFCWAELNTTDGAGAKRFYTGLFNWTCRDDDMGEGGVYTIYFKGQETVCAQYQESSGQSPPHWGVYITTQNADETARKARAAGGAVLAEPFDVGTFGRMAVLQDPQGACFQIWQPKEHIGYTAKDEPGAVCWNELITTDTAGAARFYEAVFGWKAEQSAGGGSDYTEFHNAGAPIAGMFLRRPEMGDMPPNWNMYVQVEDCDQTVEKARSLGAPGCFGPMDIPGVGRFAVLTDPQGAALNVIQIG